MSATKECVVYARVSSATQAAEGVSLDAQRARAEERAKAEGWRVVATFSDEGISGRKANRPGPKDAMAMVCDRPGRVLIVYSLSPASLDRFPTPTRALTGWRNEAAIS